MPAAGRACTPCLFEPLEDRSLMSVVTDPGAGAMQLRLTIDAVTGMGTLTNLTAATIRMDGYDIRSAAGRLDPVGWRSISDAVETDLASVRTALGLGASTFGELAARSGILAEASLSGYANLKAGASWNIGRVVTPGTASAADLKWYYITSTTRPGDMCVGQVVVVGAPAPAPLPPSVTIAKTRDAAEASAATTGRGQFTVTRSGGDTSKALVVAYTVGGTASAGSDYARLTGTVTIAAGKTTATIDVGPVDDTAVESTETVVVTLAGGSSYTVASGKGTATVSIVDNDVRAPARTSAPPRTTALPASTAVPAALPLCCTAAPTPPRVATVCLPAGVCCTATSFAAPSGWALAPRV